MSAKSDLIYKHKNLKYAEQIKKEIFIKICEKKCISKLIKNVMLILNIYILSHTTKKLYNTQKTVCLKIFNKI